ncbi:MAG: DUF1134 domain-containing protein [Sphingomonadaceae bacterium]
MPRLKTLLLALGLCLAAPAAAQVSTIDPDEAAAADAGPAEPGEERAVYGAPDGQWQLPAKPAEPAPAPEVRDTIPREDVFSAAEGVFGQGAQGLARLIEDILRDQGEPTAYIAGQEAGGAFVLGLRYGSGTLHHQIEGDRAVHWTGPSIGFDFGADASKVFVLVYNLYDSQDIFERFPGAEGNAYVIGGFTASYMRKGDIVLIPIRMGVGLRLGVNAGYMRFSEKTRWLPF